MAELAAKRLDAGGVRQPRLRGLLSEWYGGTSGRRSLARAGRQLSRRVGVRGYPDAHVTLSNIDVGIATPGPPIRGAQYPSLQGLLLVPDGRCQRAR
jgi:hypothetical protein